MMRMTRSAAPVLWAAVVVGVAGQARSAWGQDGEVVAARAPAPARAATPAPLPEGDPEARIRFNFKNTPFDQVLDFFSRETGLPVIREAEVPGSTLTFVGGTDYSLVEALSILNMNLRMHGVRLRWEENFLYLSSVERAVQAEGPVVQGEFPAELTADQIVTLVIPLNQTRATQVAEQIKPLVASYGSVQGVDAQNLLILVETAGQAERLRKIVSMIDAVRPVDSEYKVFALKHAEAGAVVEALKGLIGQRLQTVFIDAKGNQTVAEQIDIAGLNIQPDPRTNSVVAVGPSARLETVGELVEVLDQPAGAGAGGRSMLTVRLATVAASAAADQVRALFAGLEEAKRPTVLALAESGKVAVVGSSEQLDQARALLRELDPALAEGDDAGAGDRVARVVALEHVTGAQAEEVAGRLLSAAQAQVLKYSATPDGAGLVIVGPASDVAVLEQLLAGLDRPTEHAVEVRVVRVDAADAGAVFERARELDGLSNASREDPISATLEASSRTATLVGSSAAIARFEARLRDAEAGVVSASEARTYRVSGALPSVLAEQVRRLARPLLTAEDEAGYVEPRIDALDELGVLVVRAGAGQHEVIGALVAQLDASAGGAREVRVVPVGEGQAEAIKERADDLHARLTASRPESERGVVQATVEAGGRAMVLVGDAAGVRGYAEALATAQQLVPPRRETRVLELRQADAASVVAALRELLGQAEDLGGASGLGSAGLAVIERSNALLVTADASDHAMIAELVAGLDVQDGASLPPLKLLQVRAADAVELARMLDEQYRQRPSSDRTARPVSVRADGPTNTLIVAAHAELFEEIRAFVEDVNREGEGEPERTTRLFPLQVARAIDVAAAMDRLYPEPPMPVDRRNQPLPWLQKPKDVVVSADPSSNSLIFDAPTDRMADLEQLAAQLDRVQLPPRAELRTYRVIKGDLGTIARTLTALAARGVLSAPAQPGQQAVQVLVETEPTTGTLIVAGDDVTFSETEKVLARLEAVEPERRLTILPIANVPADAVRERALSIYAAQTAGVEGAEPVECSVDGLSNSLEVVGDDESTARFVAIVDQLQRQAGPAREARLLTLEMARAAEVVGFLRELVAANEAISVQGGPAPVFEPVERTNSILVAAQPAQFGIIEGLVEALDRAEASERPPLRILRLRTTDAEGLASVLQGSYDARPSEDRTKRPVRIEADPATNTLIVSAHADVLPEIESIVGDLNEQQAVDADGRGISIFPLEHARAEELARTIDEMYPPPPMPVDSRGRPRPDLQLPKEITVRADRATNALIVDAPANRLAEFERIVRELDRSEIGADAEVRTYRLERAEIGAVAEAVRALASSGGLGLTSRTPVTVTAEPGTRTLVVSGPSAAFDAIERVIDDLAAPMELPATATRIYPLRFARAGEVSALLRGVLETRVREDETRAGRDADAVVSLLHVSADERSNALIVAAPDGVQQLAEELIRTLDSERAGLGDRVIRVVPLAFAPAEEIAATLTAAAPAMDLRAPGETTVLASRGSNALILAGPAADLERVAELIGPLDVRPTDDQTLAVETFALEHADAAEIARTVESLLAQQQETDPRMIALRLRAVRDPSVFEAPRVKVEAESRTNSLIVSAPTATLELARSVIERLDQPARDPGRVARVFTPRRAEPAALAASVSQVVNETLAAGRKPAELFTAPGSASVVLLGTAEQVERAEALCAEFDASALELPQVELVVVGLTYADATAVAPTVQAMLADPTRWPEVLGQARRAGVPIAEPRVSADAAGNRLLVSVPSPLAATARSLITALDQPSSWSTVEVRVVRLERGDAASVAQALGAALSAGLQPGEPEPRVSAEPSSNSVVIAASPARLAEAESLVSAMDATARPSGLSARTIFLRHARAEAIAPLVEQVLAGESMLEQLPIWERGWMLRQMSQSPELRESEVRVAAERRMNALVIAAEAPVLELAERVVRELDRPLDGPPDGRAIRVIPLVNADASALAENLAGMFEPEASGAEPPTIRVDASGNALLVRADSAQMATIERLAAEVDRASVSASTELRLVPIDRSRADAAMMAETIRRLMEQRGGVKVRVISAEELLAPADPAPSETTPSDAGGTRERTTTPATSRPRGDAGSATWRQRLLAAPALAAIAQAAADGEAVGALDAANDSGADPEVTIAVDPATNSLIVVGAPRLTDRVVELATSLAEQIPPEPPGVHVVQLPEGTDAEAVRQVVQLTVNQVGVRGPESAGGFTGRVVVQTDPSATALIVWANEPDFEAVREVIRAVALAEHDSTLTIKVYALENITAERALASLEDLFADQPRGRQARRVRGLDVSIDSGEGGPGASARFDPQRVRVSPAPSGTAVVVAAPAEAIPLIDGLLGLLDQSPTAERLAIRRYALEHADSEELASTLEALFDAQRQGPASDDEPRARFIPDVRTNAMLVTASGDQHEQVRQLLIAADAPADDDGLELRIVALQNAAPSVVARIVEQAIVGRDPGQRDRVQVSAEDESGLLVVRAEPEVLAQIEALVEQVDTAELADLPVRSIKLERADALAVARSLQQFFQQREQASQRGGRRAATGVAIAGDRQSGTLIVAASDEDFEQLRTLAAEFDRPSDAAAMRYEIVRLANVRVSELYDTIITLANELQWERSDWFGGEQDEAADRFYVSRNDPANALILMGNGQTFDTLRTIIGDLDRPSDRPNEKIVKAVPIGKADLDAIADVLADALGQSEDEWGWWWDPDPDAISVRVDDRRRVLLIIGPKMRVEQAEAMALQLDAAAGRPEQQIRSFALEHAQAARAARSLDQFFIERARAEGLPQDTVSIIGSEDGNVLIVSSDAESLPLIEQLVEQIDQPELGDDRRIEVYYLQNRESAEVAEAVRALFPSRRMDDRVIVTPQPTTNSVVVSAPESTFAQVDALLTQLDKPPTAEDANVVTVTLESATASDVAGVLRQSLPASVKVTVTPVLRSNSLLLTGSREAIGLVLAQIKELDTEPQRQLQEFRSIRLAHAPVSDVQLTLSGLMRTRPRSPGEPEPSFRSSPEDNSLHVLATADQLTQIEAILRELDVDRASARRTDFVRLQFADAAQTAEALRVFYGRYALEAITPGARNTTIVADPASNSLVISADESEWENIRALVGRLDNEEYDTARQLVVIPLRHADASSVARALTESFRAELQDRAQQERRGEGRDDRGARAADGERQVDQPVLLNVEGVPSVAAEVQTNSLVVAAQARDLQRIERIITQLDVADFLQLPDPTLIPVLRGRPSRIAQSIREAFALDGERRGPRSVLVIGDDAAGTLIVRAEEQELAQIRALAASLETESDRSAVRVRVMPVAHVAAGRLRDTVLRTFTPVAEREAAALSVEVDRLSNALVVATTPALADEIEKVVGELDAGLAPAEGGQGLGPGSGVFIIDVSHNDPARIGQLLEQMGATTPGTDAEPGLVSERVRVVPLASRRALAVVATPRDGQTLVKLVAALDSEPADAVQFVRIVPLKLASASQIAATVERMLDPSSAVNSGAPAAALREHLRRLRVAAEGFNAELPELDLSHPIRLIADDQTNSVIVSSTEANARAVAELIGTLDRLPVGDSVVARLFPLENAAADRVKAILDELFAEGDALRRLPGTERRAMPVTATGQALAGEVAVSVDERTNTLLVAGPEEAMALIEVLVADLDREQVGRWIEPRIIALEHADATRLAETLDRVLVRGLADSPEAQGLQRQMARLRVVEEQGGEPETWLDADLFAPMSGLVIEAEEVLNALIVVGTRANIAVIEAMVDRLDVEAASAGNLVRVFPLEHAAADRVVGVVQDIFDQRQQTGALRPEDTLVISADLRTNSLMVATSASSYAVLERLLETLDAAEVDYTVGLHVVPVPGADADQLAPKIERLMRERIEASRRAGSVASPADTFSIAPDQAAGVLLIACSDENLQLVRELVAAFTSGASDLARADRLTLVPLESGSALEVAATINDLYAERENERRGPGSVTVVPNPRLNALFVSGSTEDVNVIRGMVQQLESAEPVLTQDVRRFSLRSANALEVTRLLETVLAGRPLTNQITGRAMRLRYLREDLAERLPGTATEAQVDELIREQVRLTPDIRTNSVVVVAPAPIVELIGAIVEDLDTDQRGDRAIRTFRLVNADADAMQRVLQSLFNLRRQGDTLVLVPTGIDAQAQPDEDDPLGIGATTVTAVPDTRQELAITIDARTNTLLVSGTQEYLDLVGKVVEDLDAIEANERDQLVVHLANAKADEVAEVLQGYFQGEASRLRETLQGDLAPSLARQLENEVTVVGDQNSNKLLISASPRYMDAVRAIVEELDAAPPQVMIQVLLAEVTLDSSYNWGVDVNIGGETGLGNDGYRLNKLAGFAAGAGVSAALGAPNLSVSSVDFEVLVRALEVQGKLQVLSRPQVTVKNNEPAKIEVGEDIGLVSATDRSDTGNVRADVERQQIGIILEVVPTISPDGFVQMDIIPEISSLSQREIAISEDLSSPIINRRRVETTVTVMDGQTVVIGGLIQTTNERRDNQIPGLGKLPVVGGLFRNELEEQVKTELLVILTPKIIPGGKGAIERYSDLTRSEVDRMTDPSRVIDALRDPQPHPFPTDAAGSFVPDFDPKTGWRDVQPIPAQPAGAAPKHGAPAPSGRGPAQPAPSPMQPMQPAPPVPGNPPPSATPAPAPSDLEPMKELRPNERLVRGRR